MTRIAIHLANGFEEIEAIAPTDIWRRAGFHVELISITNDLQVSGSHNIKVLADKTFEQADYTNFDMIYLPGGVTGANNLDKHEGLEKQLKLFSESNKVIGAICAAPLVLGHKNLLKGKKATCFPGFEGELTEAQVTGAQVETDGKIITGIGAGAAMDYAFAVVAYFKGQKTADELAAKMKVQKA
jgi:4-methyl-5(b-hydroxyethyl)-thiazole monophosphate biosynthesis